MSSAERSPHLSWVIWIRAINSGHHRKILRLSCFIWYTCHHYAADSLELCIFAVGRITLTYRVFQDYNYKYLSKTAPNQTLSNIMSIVILFWFDFEVKKNTLFNRFHLSVIFSLVIDFIWLLCRFLSMYWFITPSQKLQVFLVQNNIIHSYKHISLEHFDSLPAFKTVLSSFQGR